MEKAALMLISPCFYTPPQLLEFYLLLLLLLLFACFFFVLFFFYYIDLIAQAKSGTGKTCVFTVIALESLLLDQNTTQVQ